MVDIYLAKYATDFEFGNYSVVSNLALPLGIINEALATSIFSTLPLLLNKEDRLRDVVAINTIAKGMYIVKYTRRIFIVFLVAPMLFMYGLTTLKPKGANKPNTAKSDRYVGA